MKKQLLALALLGSSLANAQVWSENFSSAVFPGLPAGWTQNNVDNLTPNASIVSYSFSSGFNRAGVCRNTQADFSLPSSYSISLITTSRYTSPGTSNDWIITPQFTVPANGVLNWVATSFDPISTNGYEMRVSTTGTTEANFLANPPIFTVAAEDYSATATTWKPRGASLTAYAGQVVYVALHENNNNKWQLATDNWAVTSPTLVTDGGITSINGVTRYMIGAGNQNIQATFKELGYATATTAILHYKVNAGATVNQTFTFAPTVPYFGTTNFTFATQAAFALGTNKVKVWVSNVNGSNETVFANDTAFATVYVASQSVTINALVEEFTSSTCGPCASLNSTFDPLLTSNNVNLPGSGLNAVKYQVNWPSPSNDPSYNNDVLTRRNYYAVNSAPTVLYNGSPGSGNITNINIAKAQPGYANITASINIVGTALTASATITPFINIPSASPVKVYQALLQEKYTYTASTTSQDDYKHAMRVMFPAAGTTTTLADGTPFVVTANHNLTYASIAVGTPAQFSQNFWYNTGTFTYEYLVWLQDAVTNQVLQSQSVFTSTLSNSVVEYKNDASIGVYPNPAQDYAVVGIKLSKTSNVDITISDITGKVVYSNKGAQVNEGTNEIKINTTEFASGTYHVSVVTKEGTLTEKLIVVK